MQSSIMERSIAMADAIIFDTHRFIKGATEAGLPSAAAEFLAKEQVQLLENNLATKKDIEDLRAATKKDIEGLHAATKKDIEGLRAATKKDIEGLHAATKKDIEGLRAATKKDIEGLHAETQTDIERCKSDLIKWFTYTLLVFAGIILAGVATILQLFLK